MAKNSAKTWQQALSQWKKWSKSIESARTMIEKKNGNFEEKIAGAEIVVQGKSDGFAFELNNQLVLKWEIALISLGKLKFLTYQRNPLSLSE